MKFKLISRRNSEFREMVVYWKETQMYKKFREEKREKVRQSAKKFVLMVMSSCNYNLPHNSLLNLIFFL